MYDGDICCMRRRTTKQRKRVYMPELNNASIHIRLIIVPICDAIVLFLEANAVPALVSNNPSLFNMFIRTLG